MVGFGYSKKIQRYKDTARYSFLVKLKVLLKNRKMLYFLYLCILCNHSLNCIYCIQPLVTYLRQTLKIYLSYHHNSRYITNQPSDLSFLASELFLKATNSLRVTFRLYTFLVVFLCSTIHLLIVFNLLYFILRDVSKHLKVSII